MLETSVTRGRWWSIGTGRPVLLEGNTDSAVKAPVTLLTPTGRIRRITSETV